jgi:hypothetical protein
LSCRLTIQRSKPRPVRLMPHLGASYRRTLAGLRDRLSGPGNHPEAMALARQLIERVVIPRTPPQRPPGFTVERHLATDAGDRPAHTS